MPRLSERTEGPDGGQPDATLALSIPNRIEELAHGLDAAKELMDSWAVLPEDSTQVMIILDEIGSNIIKSAWPGGGPRRFEVTLRVVPAEPEALDLDLVAVDDGIPFDPTGQAPPDVEAGLDEREAGGLGLLMVEAMSDAVRYSRVDGRNRLQVSKRLRRAVMPG